MGLSDFFGGLIQSIIALLPTDPFTEILANVPSFDSWINYFNWFVPVGLILDVLLLWISAITVWYVWQAVARWLNLIS